MRTKLSLHRRFLILRRDGFRCHYCGASAERGAVLEVDHVVPVAAGGSDDDDNLVAACEDCNRGKLDQPKTAPKPDAWGAERRAVALAGAVLGMGSYRATAKLLKGLGHPVPPAKRGDETLFMLVRAAPETPGKAAAIMEAALG